MLAVENSCGRCRSGSCPFAALYAVRKTLVLFFQHKVYACVRLFLRGFCFRIILAKMWFQVFLPNSNHSECSEISVLRHVFQFNSITPHRLMKILCLVSCFCRIDNICFLFAGKKDSMNNNDKWGRMKECSFCDILFIRLTHPSQSP